MARALVLGGGGPVGVGWEAGLITGLAERGVTLKEADAVIGTSAGSVVGAQLSGRMDLGNAVQLITDAIARQPRAGEVDEGMEAFMSTLTSVMSAEMSAEQARRELGRFALMSSSMGEEQFLDVFSDFAGQPWPKGFVCTAVEVDNGDFVVWDAATAVELDRAVASSCSVPGVYPPVSIRGRRYMDGGMRSAVNADLAAGFDAAVVVSVMALSLPEGMSDPLLDRVAQQVEEELESVRASGTRLVMVEPAAELLDISGWGLHLMDASRAEAAFGAGVRQGRDEAARVQDVWGP